MRSRKANIDTTFTSHFFFLLLVLFPLINVCTKKQTNPLLLCIVRSDEGTQGKRKMGKFGNVMHKIIIISHEHCYMHAAIFCVDYYRGLCLKQSHTGLLFIHASSNRSLFFFFFWKRERRVWCMHACTLALRLIVAVITMQRNAFIHGFYCRSACVPTSFSGTE
jgi:hypothetical protein